MSIFKFCVMEMIAIGIYVILINIVTFGIRGWDKYQAIHKGRRVSEKQLLRLCRAGGRIGALAGMEVWRHKTIKGSFLQQFWAVVLVWLGILGLTGYHEWGL